MSEHGLLYNAFIYLLAAVIAVPIAKRLGFGSVFRVIAGTQLREIFTAFSLLLVIGIALLMQAVGLSMALGSFFRQRPPAATGGDGGR